MLDPEIAVDEIFANLSAGPGEFCWISDAIERKFDLRRSADIHDQWGVLPAEYRASDVEGDHGIVAAEIGDPLARLGPPIAITDRAEKPQRALHPWIGPVSNGPIELRRIVCHPGLVAWSDPVAEMFAPPRHHFGLRLFDLRRDRLGQVFHVARGRFEPG